MPSAGELLRAERVKRNRTLSDIASETCISKRYLEAIEVDRVSDLPGEFFYKSFLKQYAQALALDTSMTEKVLASAVPVGTADPLPVMNQHFENAQVGKSTRWSASTGVAITMLFVVLVACSALYALWQHVQAKREAAELAASRSNTVQQPVSQPQAQPVPAPITEQPAQPAPVPATESAVAPATPEPAPGQINLELAANETTWVSLSSGGDTLFAGLLEPSQTRQFSVTENARLTTGNASGLEVKMNGKPLGSVGPRGQVRTIIFTGNDFQILPPKPRTP